MKDKKIRYYILLGLFWWVITVVFSLYIKNSSLPIIDYKLQQILVPLGNSILYYPLVFITYLVDTKTAFILTLITIIILLYLYKNQYYFPLLTCTTMGGGVVITYFAKTFVQRDRPEETVFMDIWGFFTDQVSYSFPSGHVVKAFLLFTTIAFIINSEGKGNFYNVLLKGLILTIGIAQIILNRHYLTDILGGYSLAIAWFYTSLVITESIYPILDKFVQKSDFLQNKK